MRYEWDEVKRLQNLKDHGIDFVDAKKVFAGPTFTYEDDRLKYHEQRFITLGLLAGIPVSIAHTEINDVIRPISFRRATKHETSILFDQIADQLPQAPLPERREHPTQRRTPRGGGKAHRTRRRQARPKGRPT
ncbi:MAG: BrnT family toxin [Proteobacteria bacterium]|nr:BrnT family toxin [Pseudomonadota bacterium]